MAPKLPISVVIPTFNRQDLVGEAVASVRGQSFPDWEALIIDDGSTDHTRETLRPLLSPDKIRYFRQPNRGRSAARNRGVEEACGEWLLFLDSDDVLLPDALATLFQAASRFPQAGMIAGTLVFIDPAGRPLPTLKAKTALPRDSVGWVYPEMIRNAFFTPGSYLVRKELLKRMGLFETALEPCEDYDFCLRVAWCGEVAYTGIPVVQIRKHEGNTVGGSFHRSGVRVAQKHLRLVDGDGSLTRRPRRRIRADLMLNLADDYYSLGDFPQALRHYLRAIRWQPLKLFQYHVARQLGASVLAPFVKAATPQAATTEGAFRETTHAPSFPGCALAPGNAGGGAGTGGGR